MIQTVLFDFDGTLFDTGEGILRSVQYALEGFGIRETDTARLRKFVGPPLFDSFTELYGMQPAQAQAATERYRERYQPIGVYECEIYPGIPELLQRLQQAGFRMAIVSNKADPAVQLIRTLYFDGIIDVAVGESPACSKKPAPDMVLAALQRLGSTADDAIYLGDSEVDLQTARNSGLPCATVGWGFRTEAELRAAGAQTIYHSPEALGKALLDGSIQ